MRCKKIKYLDLEVYEETLENGLTIYVVPKPDKNNIYVTFTTKFGANILEFVPINEKKFTKMPSGIAHFLEHKVFEQEDGVDPFTFFTKNGADANAFTNYRQTTYLFEGPENFKENLDYLLDYVQSPYFTDKNVEKEKGIIEQEIKMYDDDPYVTIDRNINRNVYTSNTLKTPVIGSIEDVYSIQKEDLYRCYNTFYNPSNMILVVCGNVDPFNVFKYVFENQEKKKFSQNEKIKVKLEREKDKVSKEYEVIEKNISLPKIFISYKINRKVFSKIKTHLQADLLYIFACSNFGGNSKFFEKFQKEKILSFSPNINTYETKKHIVLTLGFETNYPDIILNKVENLINKKSLNEKDFNRVIKSILCSLIYLSDNIVKINRFITSSVVNDELSYTIYEDYKNLNYNYCKNVIKSISFKNKSVLVVNVKEH